MEQIQVVNKDGSYDCDINISTEEWLELLKDPKITPPHIWKLLLNIYNRVYHPDKYSEIYGSRSNDYMNLIQEFGEGIQNKLGRFQIIGIDNNPFFWVIPLIGSEKPDIWTLRSQLVQAINKVLHIQEKLFQEAIKQYKQKLRDDPSYWEGKSSDPNQRVAIANFQNEWRDVEAPEDFAEMFDKATSKAGNLLNSGYAQPRNMIRVVSKYKPQEIKMMFQKLYENNNKFSLKDKESVLRVRKSVEFFIQEAKNLTPIIKNIEKPDQQNYKLFQDINAVSTYLWFRYPDLYYKYTYERYFAVKNKLCLYQYDINTKKGGAIDSMLEGFAMYDEIRAKLLNDKELVDLINSLIKKSDFEYKDPEFHAATIDFGFFVSKHFQPSTQFNQGQEQDMNNSEFNKKVNEIADVLSFKKNVILQGAPGTGKTYITAAIALKILGVVDDNFDFSNHLAVMERYEKYKDKKRIYFTTFHQSMDYEDFVEGLKPEIIKDKDGNPIGVTYNPSKGIFKKVCEEANSAANLLIAEIENSDAKKHYGIKDNPTIWKINLDGLCGNSIHADCLNNNYICLPNDRISKDTSIPGSFLNYFQNRMKVGDIVLSSVSSSEIDAIGVVTGEYENHDSNNEFPYRRNVRWVVKDISENVVNINKGKEIARQWFHRFPRMSIQSVLDIINKRTQRETETINRKDIDEKAAVVLIIDEINRGNVSKIFGELVTLLEADKRSGGGVHPITVKLPYTKDDFSVPSNVYIIGTMNTTDRSTGTIDYAIRRRFAFVTHEADPRVIPERKARELFNEIRSFIDKNHSSEMDINDLMVGHSYFMAKNENELKYKIQYEVIPLLKEYFNDGLLTCSQKTLDDHIKKWVNLELFGNFETPSPAATEQDDEEDQE